jgi:hypothetical protein
MPGSSPGMTGSERLATERRAGKTVIRVRPERHTSIDGRSRPALSTVGRTRPNNSAESNLGNMAAE